MRLAFRYLEELATLEACRMSEPEDLRPFGDVPAEDRKAAFEEEPVRIVRCVGTRMRG